VYIVYAPPEYAVTRQEIIIDPQGQPVTVAVNVQPHVNIQPNVNMEPQNIFQPGNTINTTNQGGAAIAQSMSNATNTTINRIRLFLSQKMAQIKTVSPRAVGRSAADWCSQNKKKIMKYGAVSIYLMISIVLIQGALFIRKQTTWASWKKQLSMEELLALSQDQLGRELVHAIQQRHMNVQNPTDHITPLVRFVQEVDQEMKTLNRYLILATAIRRCRLIWIFPTNNQKIEFAQELKQRLMFVRHTFISWAATDNLANFNH
jgi:hypothetical protein